MSTTTTYDVVTRYMVQNQGGPIVSHMTNQVQGLERATSSASSWMGKLGAMAAGFFGFQQANKHLIQFNDNLEQSQITMAGLMEQAGRGTYATNVGEAAKLVKQMQLDARASIGTTQDYVNMASMLVQPLTMAGASMENLRDMTKQTVVASRSMGIEASVAARDVDQAIRGQFKSVDPFTGKIMTPLGYGGEEGRRKFNDLSMEKRLSELQRGLASPAIAAMAKAQETSFGGVTSTMLDNIQMTLGKVGMPLFKGITKEVQHWNEWLDKNQDKVNYLANVAGKKLLDFAVTFKDAVAMAAQHWDKIAVAWGGLKAAGYLAGSGGLLGAAGAVGSAGVAGKFGAAAASVSLVASVVYIGGQAIADFINGRHEKSLAAAGRFDESSIGMFESAKNGIGGQSARAFLAMAKMQGFADEKGGVSQATLRAGIEEMDLDQRKKLAGALGMQWSAKNTWSEPLAQEAAKQFAVYFKEALGMGAGDDLMSRMQAGPPLPKPEKAKVNVTINRIEVASDDPDRFVFGMVSAFRDAAKNPGGIGGSLRLMREG